MWVFPKIRATFHGSSQSGVTLFLETTTYICIYIYIYVYICICIFVMRAAETEDFAQGHTAWRGDGLGRRSRRGSSAVSLRWLLTV